MSNYSERVIAAAEAALDLDTVEVPDGAVCEWARGEGLPITEALLPDLRRRYAAAHRA